MRSAVECAGRRDKQRVSVRCPDGGRWATVEALCRVTPNRFAAHRTLLEITDCSLGQPGRSCYPGCEDQVRQAVEY